MPYTLNTAKVKYKDPSTGQYVGVDAIAEKTTAEYVTAITNAGQSAVASANTAKTNALTAINDKAQEVTSQLATSDEMEAMLADSFLSNKNYNKGQYVIVTNNGDAKLYRFTAYHAAGSWTGTDAVEVKLGNDVETLNSAIDSVTEIINYFHIDDVSNYGLTITNNDDGTITLNGTPSATWNIPVVTLPAGTYTALFYYVSGTISSDSNIALRDSSSRWANLVYTNETKTFNANESIVLRANGRTSFTNFRVKIVINKGSTASLFDDITNTAIDKWARKKSEGIDTLESQVGHDEIKAVTSKTQFTRLNYAWRTDGRGKTYSGFNTTPEIECLPGDIIDFCLVAFNQTISGTQIIISTIAFFDEAGDYIGGWATDQTTAGMQVEASVTVPQNTAFFRAVTNDSFVDSPYVTIRPSGLYEKLTQVVTQEVKIAFVGDSLTQGLTGESSGSGYVFAQKPYPIITKEQLAKIGYDATILNFGRRGLSPKTYWEDAIPVNGSWHSPASGEPGDTINFDNTIDCAIIMLGTNGSIAADSEEAAKQAIDTATSGQTYPYTIPSSGDQNVKHIAAYCNIIEYIMDETDNHAQIILVAPIYANDDRENRMIKTLPTVKALGERYQIPVINALYESGLGKFNKAVFYNQTDLLHLNQAGYHKLGTFMASKFSSLYSTFDMDELPSS